MAWTPKPPSFVFTACLPGGPVPTTPLLGWVTVGTLFGSWHRPHLGALNRFNKLAVGSVVESAFRKLKHLQVLDIEGNFEFGDVSKDRGRLEKEEEEEDDDEEEEEERR